MDVEPSEQLALYACDVMSDGKVETVPGEPPETNVPSGVAYRWIHIDLNHSQARSWIASTCDQFVTEALTRQDTRPRCTRHAGGLILILRGVNLNPDSDPEDMVSIRLWVTENLIISVRLRRLMAVVSLRDRMDANDPPPTTADFISYLAAGLTEKMDPVITSLTDKTDELEDRSIENQTVMRADLSELRRTTIILRRYVAPQRDALNRLSMEPVSFITDEQRIAVRETVDRIMRLVEELEALRERSIVLYEQLSDKRAEEMNRNMLVLSVVAAVFLPLGFLTGLLGVNIGGIPGANVPWAFGVFSVFLILISTALLWYFRKLKWI
ncbi:zinc transporter ZntB [Parvularcula sp. IMCC14364]|uniref:zinc transporter ZntB n=1 Tax=Parvularcula sp. IMCC14364 TaxID=3067902 RepID=UPI0027423834|nr:zinc transporter ZntB [Parvularcula sp. IMCC14364]